MTTVETPMKNLIKYENEHFGILKNLYNYSAPVLEKVNSVKGDYEKKGADYYNQVLSYKDQAMEKGNQYKNLVMEKKEQYTNLTVEMKNHYKNLAFEKSNQYKDLAMEKGKNHKVTKYTEAQLENIVEKGKNHKVTKYTEAQLENIVSYMEKQVERLNNHYSKTHTGDENLVIQNYQNQVLSKEEQSQNLVKRMQTLSQTINVLARITVLDQLKKIQEGPMGQNALAYYQQVMTNPRVREAIIFTTITQEFLSDMIQTKLLTPTRTFYETKSLELKNSTQITIENMRTKVMKQYIPLAQGKYESLKNATVHFYNNQMTVEFAKGYYQTNQALIQKEMKDFYGKFLQFQQTRKEQYIGAYSNALDSYKKRRMEKITQFENKEELEVKKNE